MSYCHRCERHFESLAALCQHEQGSQAHNLCNECQLDFPTRIGLKEHWVQSPCHSFCGHCNQHYPCIQSLEAHYSSDHDYCTKCRRLFKSDHGLREHYRQSPLHSDSYCVPCNRLFISPSNLQSHLRSAAHQPKDVLCPVADCNQAFVSRSALVLHLESGSCCSGLTLTALNQEVRRYDTNNFIIDNSRLVTRGDVVEEVTYAATNAAWNGSMYECYLCHNEFLDLRALNQHLASPRHHQKIYVCPLDTCRMRFTTLSALCQHIESEKCGVSRFGIVRMTMNSLISRVSDRLIAF